MKNALRFLKSIPILFLLGATVSIPALSQFQTNGSAADLGGGCFQLTPDLFYRSGSVWSQNKISLATDFQLTATINLGTRNVPSQGADGIAFVLQPICTGLGGNGGGLGFQGIDPSLAIEFDTWQNGSLSDPAQDHIALISNGDLNHAGANNLAGPFTTGEMENGQDSDIAVSWDATAKQLSLNFNGGNVFTYSGDIVTSIFSGNAEVFWGFTAGTGAARNLQTVCDINLDAEELAPFIVTDVSCPGASDGAIELDLTGGVAPFTFDWSTGDNTEDISGIPAGDYSVNVTDANGCVSTFQIVVGTTPDNTPPELTCPAPIVVSTDPGECGAVVCYDIPSFTDDCSNVPDELAGYTLLGDLNGSRYFLSDAQALSVDARAAAVALGGHLATITSEAENNFLATNTAGLNPWVGYSDRAIEGTFIWETGEKITYENWLGGEPNDFEAGEDFTVINFGGPGLWNDEQDIFLRQWIVEFDGLAVLEPNEGLGSGSFFPVGTTELTYVATDLNGNTSSCVVSITVEDTEAPAVFNCVGSTHSADENCEFVNGFDEENRAGTFTIAENCGPVTLLEEYFDQDNNEFLELEFELGPGGYVLGSGRVFPLGVNTVVLTVTDGAGNQSSCSFEVTVVDDTPPTLTTDGEVVTLWPPNHKYHTFDMRDFVTAIGDNCADLSADDIYVSSVTSDEPENDKGDGNTLNDMVIGDDCQTVALRAERQGTSNGRVYTITVAVDDGNGNSTSANVLVQVPHNKKAVAVDDGAAYTVTGCGDVAQARVAPKVSDIVAQEAPVVNTAVYPNPFIEMLNIDFVPAYGDHVKVNIYNVSGAKVATLFDGEVQEQKAYSWSFVPGASVRPGVLIAEIKGEETHIIRKISYRK